MTTSNITPVKNQTNKGFKMIVENKNIDLLSMIENTTKIVEPTKMELWKVDILKQAKKEVQKELNAKKRALNPTVPKLVSDQKRENISAYKSNAKTVLIGTKNLIKQIQSKDLNEFENIELIKKANSMVNYITSPKNSDLLDLFLTFARPTKNGFYTESNFSFLIQQITKISIDKNKDFSESINYFEALRKAKK